MNRFRRATHSAVELPDRPRRSRSLLVKLLVATLIGVSLPALAATPALAVSGCDMSVANAVRPSGSPVLPGGSFICEYGVTWTVYDSRWHAFLVGTDASNTIYHTWQGSGGGPYVAWTSLGGTGRDSVRVSNYSTSGRLAIEVAVKGVNNVQWCKNYNGNIVGGWWPGPTSWTSNASSCRLF